ncbi:capsular polysaccharide biosynthesis protein [Sulfurimonas marina]|uniref:Capsular polysaccharide biosynthesis protein n=1 Tax=Sulfurimonas marina TaxID=2590551 RepID=A0A7M1AVI9_9BACT|nr:capsular polysaccharide biosynthesis protein [Sulfurimonas marina]QOP41430.1 capsular polysaccharide biosynthesis protein [Sulfurimonas marina]
MYYLTNIRSLLTTKNFKGWGRKKTGRFAVWCHKIFGGTLNLQEDGFIRSLGLGVDGSPSFSLVEDDVGIYYDATVPSRLENILNSYDFSSDLLLLKDARKAIELIKQYHISKYNNAPDISEDFFVNENEKRVLVIAQTAGDTSLEYGMLDSFTTEDMIRSAIEENPDAKVYIKIHPDVLSGKKVSDIDPSTIDKRCTIITENVNSISLLKHFTKVYTKTSQMGFEALLVGCECVCFGMPFYAGWGITTDKSKCERRIRTLSVEEVFAAAYILYTRYYNPYTNKPSDIFDTIETISKLKKENTIDNKAYFFGFSRWKHGFIRPFFSEYDPKYICFINPILSTHLKLALKKGLGQDSQIYFWGRKSFPEIEKFAEENGIKIFRVEDGFIRSVGLGSDLTQPYSQVIDKRGIYFDPTQESDLENLLQNYDFDNDKELLQRASALKEEIVKNKISKYNSDAVKALNFPKDKTVALVTGQVEDDASIRFGANGMTNLELLQTVKKKYPDRYIIFKPHPDVLSGNRVGNIPQEEALNYCDEIVSDISMASVLEAVDEVHTLTSLTGFEGLVYGKKVYTYGMPFYAGWGLTIDERNCERRTRVLTLEQLIAATYLRYPRYISPKTKKLCEAEDVIKELKEQKDALESSVLLRIKFKFYSYLSRISQKLLSLVA